MSSYAVQAQAGALARLIAQHPDEQDRAALVALALKQLAELSPVSDIHVHEAESNIRLDLVGDYERAHDTMTDTERRGMWDCEWYRIAHAWWAERRAKMLEDYRKSEQQRRAA